MGGNISLLNCLPTLNTGSITVLVKQRRTQKALSVPVDSSAQNDNVAAPVFFNNGKTQWKCDFNDLTHQHSARIKTKTNSPPQSSTVSQESTKDKYTVFWCGRKCTDMNREQKADA